MKKSTKGMIGMSVGLAAAAAVGTYLLYGPGGAKHRKLAKAWMRKAKGELIKEVKKLKVVSKDAYHAAVRRVLARYRTMKSIDAKDVAAFMAHAKQRWTVVKKHAMRVVKRAARSVR